MPMYRIAFTATTHPAAILKVWEGPGPVDLSFTVLFNGTPTPRAELPPDARAAAEKALRERHPRHARYFLDGK